MPSSPNGSSLPSPDSSSPDGRSSNGSVPDRLSAAASKLPAGSADAGEALEALKKAARIVLRRRFRLLLLVRDAYDRLAANASAMDAVWEDLRTTMRLLQAWAERSYERVPWAPLVLMAAAVLYFVLPFDVVPDFLAGIGFVDDVAVISTVVQSVRSELDRFRDWED